MLIPYIDNCNQSTFQKVIDASGLKCIVSIDKFYGCRWYNRYIQFRISNRSLHIHYELVPKEKGVFYIEFHIEKCNENPLFLLLYKELHKQTRDNQRLSWYPRNTPNNKGCRLLTLIRTEEEMVSSLKEMTDIFDEKISLLDNLCSSLEKHGKYNKPLIFDQIDESSKDRVFLTTKTLKEILSYNFTIPEYQRIYCWEDKQVKDLWNDLKEVETRSKFHLGSIILQKHTGNEDEICYHIIDGQQRLVTLSLILNELNYKGQLPLLRQRFKSSDAIKHVANSKAVIESLLTNTLDNSIADNLVEKVFFSVLVINEDRLDLAYTFFSSQNSKGVPLSDYDLLKAHHLRYIFVEAQAEHLARRWNMLSTSETSSGERYLETTIGDHLYRMRKWMRRTIERNVSSHYIKDEFSSAPTIEGIPPFCERFYFYDKIQGGTHFFAYSDHFVSEFKRFLSTNQSLLLRRHLMSSRHWAYAQAIETLLYGYYLKFGDQYLSEALFCISGVIAQHRYAVTRAIPYKVMEAAHESELMMMIDQASSPTFFLAESLSQIKVSGQYQEEQVKYDFYKSLSQIFRSLKDFTEESIQNLMTNEYF